MKEIINKTLADVFTKAIMEEAVKKMAFLSFGPLNALVSHFIFKVLKKALDKGLLEIAILFNNKEVDGEVNDVEKAKKKVMEAKDEESLQEAERELEEAAWDLISFKS